MSGGAPTRHCGHGQMCGGRAQGMAGLVSDRALRTRDVFMAVLGQIPSCRVGPVAGPALAGMGALVSAGEDEMPPLWWQSGRCHLCGRTGDDGPKGCQERIWGNRWALVPGGTDTRGARDPSRPSLPTYLQEEPHLPERLCPVRGGCWGAAPCHGPQRLRPVLQPGSHSPEELCEGGQPPSPLPASTAGRAQAGARWHPSPWQCHPQP